MPSQRLPMIETMLYAIPIKLKEANAFIAEHHRHHKPVKFHLFSIGCRNGENDLCAVAVIMRPAAPAYNDYPIAEICRLASDGTKNACSFLLARAARAAFEMGYWMIQTYTLAEESGVSLAAAGWEHWGTRRGSPWNHARRKRNDSHPIGPKDRWVRIAPELERRMKRPPSLDLEDSK